jgi:hypothetical protein
MSGACLADVEAESRGVTRASGQLTADDVSAIRRRDVSTPDAVVTGYLFLRLKALKG